ncbi:hypothetical protein [Silvibacterium dinghuense]|uniref:DUF922 domain-containing protein n=1 Tax=Silvibacterium dinghuense TaxID=1560006 RepID=A0A4Q1SCT9_9BACT|nr:hypothetical protein [Silvibacterium dinghuense]RXS95026.1 hypothetical protein ESZ00_10380 [Silvibacterium dinghuense]GGH09980.1 hypothetical protein GCM10011586_28110 [Silvibacterium dinghuense]
MKAVAAAWLFAVGSAVALGQQATITFSFENPQLQPPQYRITLHEDGSGQYESAATPATAGVDVPTSDAAALNLPAMKREIRIADPLLEQVFALARSHHFFDMACEAPKEHTAFTGKKLWSYEGTDGHGACTYNFSKDPQVNALGEQMEAVAYTLAEGQRLDLQHLHSRLALDAELENLQDSFREHRAAEIANIAPTLKAIAGDQEVMERARKRALSLLAASEKEGAQ